MVEVVAEPAAVDKVVGSAAQERQFDRTKVAAPQAVDRMKVALVGNQAPFAHADLALAFGRDIVPDLADLADIDREPGLVAVVQVAFEWVDPLALVLVDDIHRQHSGELQEFQVDERLREELHRLAAIRQGQAVQVVAADRRKVVPVAAAPVDRTAVAPAVVVVVAHIRAAARNWDIRAAVALVAAVPVAAPMVGDNRVVVAEDNRCRAVDIGDNHQVDLIAPAFPAEVQPSKALLEIDRLPVDGIADTPSEPSGFGSGNHNHYTGTFSSISFPVSTGNEMKQNKLVRANEPHLTKQHRPLLLYKLDHLRERRPSLGRLEFLPRPTDSSACDVGYRIARRA